MVIAEVKGLQSPDVRDLERYKPPVPDNFGFLLEILAGPQGTNGEESFDVVVCTRTWLVNWLAQTLSNQEIVIVRHYLVVEVYDYDTLRSFLHDYARRCTGATWREAALKLSRLGWWEFEDYNEEPPIEP